MREIIVMLPGSNYIMPIQSEYEETLDQMLKNAVAKNQEPTLIEFCNGTRKARINSRSILGWCFRDTDLTKQQREARLAETMQHTMEKIGGALSAEDDSNKWKRGEDED